MISNRRPAEELLVADPGPWSIVSFVREAQGAQIMGRGGSRKATSAGLLSDIVPDVPMERPGLDASLETVGGGLIRLVSVVRGEGARRLYFEENSTVLRGVAPRVIRRYSVPDLTPGPHEYPDEDPGKGIALPQPPYALAEPVEGEVTAPSGRLAAAPIKDGRLFGLAFVRLPERTLVRFIGGAACAAWSDDGSLLAIGGDWGVILAEAADAAS